MQRSFLTYYSTLDVGEKKPSAPCRLRNPYGHLRKSVLHEVYYPLRSPKKIFFLPWVIIHGALAKKSSPPLAAFETHTDILRKSVPHEVDYPLRSGLKKIVFFTPCDNSWCVGLVAAYFRTDVGIKPKEQFSARTATALEYTMYKTICNISILTWIRQVGRPAQSEHAADSVITASNLTLV